MDRKTQHNALYESRWKTQHNALYESRCGVGDDRERSIEFKHDL